MQRQKTILTHMFTPTDSLECTTIVQVETVIFATGYHDLLTRPLARIPFSEVLVRIIV